MTGFGSQRLRNVFGISLGNYLLFFAAAVQAVSIP